MTVQAVPNLSDYELERGKPMPSKIHSGIQVALGVALWAYSDKYSILSELSLELDGRPFVPDLSIYRKLEMDLLRDEVKMTVPPLVAIEILSPTQSLDDLVHKAQDYFAVGVESCWIVQPGLHAVAVLQPGELPRTYTTGAMTDPATSITVDVDEIFRSFSYSGH